MFPSPKGRNRTVNGQLNNTIFRQGNPKEACVFWVFDAWTGSPEPRPGWEHEGHRQDVAGGAMKQQRGEEQTKQARDQSARPALAI